MNLERFKNPYFWMGLIGVIFAAAGVNLEALTTWSILWQNILEVLSNPFLLMSVTMAVLGVFIDPTTKGITDCPIKKVESKESQE